MLYSNILFATDLGPQSLYIGQQAIKLRKMCQTDLYMLHIIEPLITYTTHFSEQDKMLKKMQALANKSLVALGAQLDIQKSFQLINIGSPTAEIIKLAHEKQSTLIIVGSHGSGGYAHALGSTAQNLISTAPCDVLIIQVNHLEKEIDSLPPSIEFSWKLPSLTLSSSSEEWKNAPKLGGSVKGFGEEVRRGPRLSIRPANTPYKGGTRTRTSEEDLDEKE